MKKTLAIAGAITAVGVSTLAGVGAVSAHAAQNDSGDSGLAAKIAQKFNLNKDEVKKVIQEDHAAHRAEMEAKMQERLDQAVKDGKLTQDQADTLKAKQKELQSTMESLKGKTPEEHRDAMKAKMEEFQKWADQNNIPQEFRMPGGGPGLHIMTRDDGGQTTIEN